MIETILKTAQKTRIGRQPVVVLPLAKWREIEEMIEDWEMYNSEKLRQDIAKARKEKGAIPLESLLKKYKFYSQQKNPLEYADHLKDFRFGQRRFRIGGYRVIFDVEKDKIVILKIGHRKDIYR